MKAAIPVHREKIKEASKSDLNDFLENVRRISPMIGEKAMKHVSTLFYDNRFFCWSTALYSWLLFFSFSLVRL